MLFNSPPSDHKTLPNPEVFITETLHSVELEEDSFWPLRAYLSFNDHLKLAMYYE